MYLQTSAGGLRRIGPNSVRRKRGTALKATSTGFVICWTTATRITPFKQCSQESERKAIAQKVSETIAWLHDKGDLAETSQFWDKRNVIECDVIPCFQWRCCLTALISEHSRGPIVHRYQEIEAFPQALNISQMWNWSTRAVPHRSI